MLTSITLQNFKSFGEEQTLPLQPITVLVGPNNSGKSNLVSLARFVRDAAERGGKSAFDEAGGVEFVFRRPGVGDGRMRIGWNVDDDTQGRGSYATTLERVSSTYGGVPKGERFALPASGRVWDVDAGENPNVFFKLHSLVAPWKGSAKTPDADAFRAIWRPMVTSREMKLDIGALRRDADLVPEPRLGDDGSGMAPVLSLWRGANFDRAAELDALVHQCLPEIKHVLVKPSPVAGKQRLWVQQTDGEQFDAAHVSDGVLCFIALAMHALAAEPGALLFVEEPEQSIHPRRLHDLVELFRAIVHTRRCQIVLVTHSPTLLHEFRDEPEAILLFRRDEQRGTRVDPLTGFPHLMEALHTRGADPGHMLVDGFLNAPS